MAAGSWGTPGGPLYKRASGDSLDAGTRRAGEKHKHQADLGNEGMRGPWDPRGFTA